MVEKTAVIEELIDKAESAKKAGNHTEFAECVARIFEQLPESEVVAIMKSWAEKQIMKMSE